MIRCDFASHYKPNGALRFSSALTTLYNIEIFADCYWSLPRFFHRASHRSKGPYRESFAEYCAELQSGALPVLIRCPNAVNDVGINREKWLPNPAVGREGSSAALHGEMLLFLGRLMGVAIRSQQPLDLDIPSIVWKQLVRSPITRYSSCKNVGILCDEGKCCPSRSSRAHRTLRVISPVCDISNRSNILLQNYVWVVSPVCGISNSRNILAPDTPVMGVRGREGFIPKLT